MAPGTIATQFVALPNGDIKPVKLASKKGRQPVDAPSHQQQFAGQQPGTTEPIVPIDPKAKAAGSDAKS